MADMMTLEQVRNRLRNWCDPHKGYPSAEMNDWADVIDAAIKQREQDVKDAARYRWIRDMRNRERAAELVQCKMNLDAAIDASMAKESGQ